LGTFSDGNDGSGNYILNFFFSSSLFGLVFIVLLGNIRDILTIQNKILLVKDAQSKYSAQNCYFP